MNVHRLPGLESSDNNKVEEDVMYNDMMRSVLRMVLKPILTARAEHGVLRSASHGRGANRGDGGVGGDDEGSRDGRDSNDNNDRDCLVISKSFPLGITKAEAGLWDVTGGRGTAARDAQLCNSISNDANAQACSSGVGSSVSSGDGGSSTSAGTWANLMNWRAFTKKNLHRVRAHGPV